MDRPPSTIGSSVSVCETATPKRKVNFSISHYNEGLKRESPKKDVQTDDIPTTWVQDSLQPDGGGQTYDTTMLEIKDMDMTTPDCDVYHGIYPDF